MSVCGEEEGEKIGVLLTDFYNGMGTAEEAAAKEAKAKEMEAKMAALAAKKKAEEEEAALRAKEEEELAAAKKAEEEAAAAAAEIKKADEAAKAAARKRRIEEAEAAEAAKKKEEEAAAAAAEAKRLEEESATVEAKRVDEAAAAAKIVEEETEAHIKEQPEKVNANEEVAEEEVAQEAAKEVEEDEAKKDEVVEKAQSVEPEATGTTEEVDSTKAATNVEKKAHIEEQTEEDDVLFNAQKRTEKAAAAMRAIKKAQEEAKLVASKKTEIRPKKEWTKPLSSGSSNFTLENKDKLSSRRLDEQHLETMESKPVHSEDGDIIHAPMSRDLAGIRRGELEKIKQSRSNLHISIRGHWEDRVQTNDQTHVSLVAQARAKVEKGASLTRYLELQEASKRVGVDAIDEESRELGRDVQPPGDSPTNTNFQRRNSRETAKIYEAQIDRNEEAIAIAPADIAMYHASNQGDDVDFKALDQINQLQHAGFEEDWQSAEEAAKDRMGSFRGGSAKHSPQRTTMKESEDAQLAKAEATGPDVSLYGDTAISHDSNRKVNSDYVPMPDPIPGDLGTSKSTEASDVDETGEKPKEALDVIKTKQTPVVGSANGVDVGEVSDGYADKMSKDQMPIIQYGEAPVIYEGDETVGENRAQDWHEQATKDGDAVGDNPIQDDANENVADDEIANKTEDAHDAEVVEPEAAKSEEELAAEKEAADAKRAEEAAAAAAKKAEEKAQRKAERKAAKKAKSKSLKLYIDSFITSLKYSQYFSLFTPGAEEKAAAKKAEEEAAAAAAAEAARIKAEEEALKKNCTGCIIS